MPWPTPLAPPPVPRRRADFTSTPGVGVTATVDGRQVEVGAPARLLDSHSRHGGHDGTLSGCAAKEVADLEDGGRTAVLVLRDGVPVGVLGIADRLRPDAAATVAALTALTSSTPLLVTR